MVKEDGHKIVLLGVSFSIQALQPTNPDGTPIIGNGPGAIIDDNQLFNNNITTNITASLMGNTTEFGPPPPPDSFYCLPGTFFVLNAANPCAPCKQHYIVHLF